MMIKNIVNYLNNGEYEDLDTAIQEELDRQLIYYDDQWKLDYNFTNDESTDNLYYILYNIIIVLQ